MKQLSPDTVGGRIRAVRLEGKETMDDFAARLGISPSYLGFLERGTRNPSKELLQKIAIVAEVDYGWLKDGDAAPQAGKATTNVTASSNNNIVLASALNPKLFLSTVLEKAPISKDTMAAILMVPVETVDKILGGEPVSYDPRWDKAYSILAGYLDLPAVRQDVAAQQQDLTNLALYLEREESNAKKDTLHHVLLQYAKKSFKTVEIESIETEMDDTSSLCWDMSLRCKGDDSSIQSSWYFRYFPGPVNALSVPDIIRSADSGLAHVSLVLTDEQAFDSFCKYCDNLQSEADATANLDGVCAPELPSVSLILYDEKKGITDDWSFDD